MKQILLSLVLGLSFLNAHAAKTEAVQMIDVVVTIDGYEPSQISVKPNIPVVLNITRKTDSTCATDIQVPAKKIDKIDLPLNKSVQVKLGKLEKGEIAFGCSMNMMIGGTIIVK